MSTFADGVPVVCASCGHEWLAHHEEDDDEGSFEWCGGTTGRNCGCTQFVKVAKEDA